MRQIQFSVRSQTLYYHKREIIVADSQDYLYAQFSFTEDWNDTVKYAQFIRADKFWCKTLDEECKCVVPWEVLVGEGTFKVSVFATNKEGIANQFITTNLLEIYVAKSGLAKLVDKREPTQGVLGESVENAVQQIKSQEEASVEVVKSTEASSLDALSDELNKALEALNNVKIEVDALKKAAQTSATNAATSETNAKDSETAAANSASQALASKNAAATSETNALASQKAAAQSEADAKTSEQNALDSQKAAANSATEAETSNQESKGWATNANTSATNAATSASASKTNADTAVTAANTAVAKANAAAESEAKAKEYAEAASEITQSQGTIYIDDEGYVNILEVEA